MPAGEVSEGSEFILMPVNVENLHLDWDQLDKPPYGPNQISVFDLRGYLGVSERRMADSREVVAPEPNATGGDITETTQS